MPRDHLDRIADSGCMGGGGCLLMLLMGVVLMMLLWAVGGEGGQKHQTSPRARGSWEGSTGFVFVHTGAAAMFSLITGAKRNNLNVYRYLSDVFRRLPATPTSELYQFLPDRWQPRDATAN
jgi:hypothetical protein